MQNFSLLCRTPNGRLLTENRLCRVLVSNFGSAAQFRKADCKKIPYEYIDFDNVVHTVTPEIASKINDNSETSWNQLRRQSTTLTYAKEEKPVYMMWNIKVTKEFSDNAKLSFFVNGILDVHPQYESGTSARTKREWSNHYNVENLNITPAVKADYKSVSRSGRHGFTAGILYCQQIAQKHSYDVEIINSAIPHVDFQTCFAPYAYFASEFGVVAGELSYQYNFTKLSPGLRLCGFWLSGNRVSGVQYDKTVGYNSVCPMISTFADSHNEKWLNASLFVKF